MISVLLWIWKCKLLFIMRLAFSICLFACCMSFATGTFSQNQRLSINQKNISIENVIQMIEDQTDYYFMYSALTVDVKQTVDMQVTNKSVAEILDNLFKDTNITWKINGRLIALSVNGTSTEISQQPRNISGKVTDSSGTPLPGVTVVVKGTSVGVITDVNGGYTLPNIPDDATLVFSFVGMKTQEVAVKGKTSVNIALTEETIGLEEVVAIGYGTTTKRQTTAAISTINSEELQNLPVATLGDGLAGRSNGVFVTASGGGPGKKPAISIRGGDTPLIVIDGIVASINDFQNLNSADIENFSILKDAEAAAIYGARAGNGIIAITTKKGVSGEMNIKYAYSYNLARPTVMPKKLNSYESVLIANEASINDNQGAVYSDEVVQKYKDQSDPYNYPNTDWQELCLKTFAPSSRHDLVINGGSEKTKYYASVSSFHQGTLYTFDTNWLKRYNYRFSLTNNFDKIGLTANVNIYGTLEKLRIPNSQYGSGYYFIWGHIQNSGPTGLAYTDLGLYSNQVDHPLVEMDPNSGYDKTETRNVNGILDLTWNVPWVEGLKIKAINHYRLDNGWEKSWNATAYQYNLGSSTPITQSEPKLYSYAATGYSYTNQFYGEYNKEFAKGHKIAATFGYEQSYGYDEDIYAQRVGYTILFDQFLAGPTANSSNGGTAAENARAGYIGRLRYDYKSKYYAEASIRRDGSDWFPKAKRWGTFWSGSGGWVISEENFMKRFNSRNGINFFKLRGSYGVVGLDGEDADIERFQYIEGYNLNENGYVIGRELVSTFSEGSLVSPDLSWYTQKSANIGFDFTSLDYKLSGSFDYFFMKTTGMLASLSESKYTDPLGTDLPTKKSDGELRRAGFEINLNYKNSFGDLQYGVGVNLSKYEQLWKMNPEEDESTLKNPYTRTTNQTNYWGTGYHCLGYYTSAEDIMNSPKLTTSTNLVPGDLKYDDINGDGLINSSDQRRIGNSESPRLMYGVTMDLRYKPWSFSALIQGTGNRSLYPGDVIREGHVYKFQTNYWTPENTNAKYPRLMSSSSYNGSNNTVTSDFWLVNGRYIRLKSLQIGYDFKYKILKEMSSFSEASVILSGSNLFTISEALRRYKMDPEAGINTNTGEYNNYDYPTERIFSLTVRLGF